MGEGRRQRRRRESSPEETARERIERSAARLYAIHGFDGVSMREIAEAAGVTKPLVYYHFESKESLYGGLLSSAIEECMTMLRSAPQTGDPKGRLREHLAIQVGLAREEPEIYGFVHATLTAPGLLPLGFDYRSHGRRLIEIFASVVREGQRAGQFRAVDPELVVIAALATLDVYVAQILAGMRDRLPEDLHETLFDLLMRGLEVSKA